jgi:hypothetical protein
MVLSPERVMELCNAIIARRYRTCNLVVQADSVTMARNEEMVRTHGRGRVQRHLSGHRECLQEEPANRPKGRHRRRLPQGHRAVPTVRHHGGGRHDLRFPGGHGDRNHRKLSFFQGDPGRHRLLPDPDPLSQNRYPPGPPRSGPGHQPRRFRPTTACGPTCARTT